MLVLFFLGIGVFAASPIGSMPTTEAHGEGRKDFGRPEHPLTPEVLRPDPNGTE